MPNPIVSARKETLSQRHPDAVGEALSQGTGRRLDAGGEEVLRVAWRPRFPLPEGLDVLHREVVTGKVEQSVLEHGRVPGGEDETVPIFPVRVLGVVAQELEIGRAS